MASMGLLGAVKGGANGFDKFLSAELQAERQARLEELRTTNRRETLEMDRSERDRMARERAGQENEMTLERLKAIEDYKSDKTGVMTDDTYGGVVGQRNSVTNEFKATPMPKSSAASQPNWERIEENYTDPETGESGTRTTGFTDPTNGKFVDAKGRPEMKYGWDQINTLMNANPGMTPEQAVQGIDWLIQNGKMTPPTQ